MLFAAPEPAWVVTPESVSTIEGALEEGQRIAVEFEGYGIVKGRSSSWSPTAIDSHEFKGPTFVNERR